MINRKIINYIIQIIIIRNIIPNYNNSQKSAYLSQKKRPQISTNALFYRINYLFLIAAWAAASLAIGTRNGEQET